LAWAAAHFEAAVQELQVSLSYAQHQYPDTPVSRLLVVGARGTGGVARLLLGSVAEGALTRCPAPVLIVR